jgi:two-component sensor histidine kinase
MAARQNNNNGVELNDTSSARESWSNCEAALADSRIGVAASDVDGRYTWLFNTPRGFPSKLVGLTDEELLAPETAEALSAAKREVLETGEPRELELQLDDDQGPRWYDARVRIQRRQGRVVGTVLSFVDITDRKVQEEHLRIVLRELAHRSKNLLSVIQGIARQTAESAESLSQFLSRFNGRIFSLSRAHDVLTDADWRGARIFDLVRSQIALYAENRLGAVTMEGENGFLRPNAAQYMGLALHELITNALKYGALSRDDGTIAVRFERSETTPDHFSFSWRETSSVEPRELRPRSFGMIMLTEVVPTSVSGEAELSFEPDGVHYRLEVPKAQLVG